MNAYLKNQSEDPKIDTFDNIKVSKISMGVCIDVIKLLSM